MKLKREFDADGKKEFWALVPEMVNETAICHLLSKEYPYLFEFISEFTLGGLREEIYLKIKEIEKLGSYQNIKDK